MIKLFQRFCLVAGGCAVLLLMYGLFTGNESFWQVALAVALVSAALGIGAIPRLRGTRFTLWILTAVAMGLLFPSSLLSLGPLELGNLRLPAISLKNKSLMLVIVQLVMFGMGTKMSIQDFRGVARMPYPVCIGVMLQFLIMPLIGYLLAKLFDFPPEIAAGIILIGSCSSGLASNVMCYVAGANLALSITLTTVATLLSPLITPFWMEHLAGEFVQVDKWQMSAQIAKIVLLPIGAAMLHDHLKQLTGRRRIATLIIAAILGGIGISVRFYFRQYVGEPEPIIPPAAREWLFLVGAAILASLSYHFLVRVLPVIDNQMHLLSMGGIVYFTAVTTAAGRDNLLVCGFALILAAIIHNLSGYALGYGCSRLAGLDKHSALTVAFEVGMQNGGMASGLAALMDKLATVGLASAVFSPWMNISGSLLANLVKRQREKSQL